jgi:hypothetical protein
MVKGRTPVCAICERSTDVRLTAWSSKPECDNPHCTYLRTLVRSRRLSRLTGAAVSPPDGAFHREHNHVGTFLWCQDDACRAARRMERIAV